MNLLKINGKFNNITQVSAYVLTEDAEEAVKDCSCDELEKIYLIYTKIYSYNNLTILEEDSVVEVTGKSSLATTCHYWHLGLFSAFNADILHYRWTYSLMWIPNHWIV